MRTVEDLIDVNGDIILLTKPTSLVRDSDLGKATTMLVRSRVGVDEINLLLVVRIGNRGQVGCIKLDQNLVGGCVTRPVGSYEFKANSQHPEINKKAMQKYTYGGQRPSCR